jgi:Short C-terminal domain
MTDVPQQVLLRQFLDALREGSIPFATSVLAKSPVTLRSGESLAFVCHEAALKESHAVDKGDLVLTTQRYVFLGQKRTIAVDLSEIIGVEPYGDAVAVHRAGKEQTEMYGDLNRQEIAYTPDGQRTLISGLVVACALEGLMTRDRATSRPTPAPVPEADPATLLTRSTADELAKLADLRDRGVLTDEEFAKLKAELIG